MYCDYFILLVIPSHWLLETEFSNGIKGNFSLFQLEHSGEYVCEAIGYSVHSTPGAQTTVSLQVERRKYQFDLLLFQIE